MGYFGTYIGKGKLGPDVPSFSTGETMSAHSANNVFLLKSNHLPEVEVRDGDHRDRPKDSG